jgi:hypothetical protein
MKTIRLTFYLLIATTLIISCSKEKEETAVWINFINTTDNKITLAKAEDINLGTIASKGQTGYKKIESFGKNSGIPVIFFYGMLNGQQLESLPLRCGMGTDNLQPGKYDILVETVNYGAGDYFMLSFK